MSQKFDGWEHRVYRKRYENEPLHGGNIENDPEMRCYSTKAEAQARADELNNARKENT